MDSRFRYEIPIVWHFVRDVRQHLGESLADQSAALREAAVMVASELVENAIKYGDSVPNARHATIELFVNAEQVQIVVTNGLTSADRALEVAAALDRIADAPDPSVLYVERLQLLLENPNIKGKLGFLRIGLEAGFELESSFDDGVLTITATRGIS